MGNIDIDHLQSWLGKTGQRTDLLAAFPPKARVGDAGREQGMP